MSVLDPDVSGATGTAVAPGERPVWVAKGDDVIFGVHNPPIEASDAALVCVHNGSYNMSAHHNQVWARLCRAAAANGVHALRYDPVGTGASTGEQERNPYGSPADDVAAVVTWLAERGVRRVGLVGTCRGAMIALGAVSKVPEVVGLFLCAPALAALSVEHDGSEPWEAPSLRAAIGDGLSLDVARRLVREADYRAFVFDRAWRRLRRTVGSKLPLPGAARRPAESLLPDGLQPLREAVDRELHVEIFLGEQDSHYRQLQGLEDGELDRLLHAPSVTIDVVPGAVHRFITLEGQQRFLQAATRWSSKVLGS